MPGQGERRGVLLVNLGTPDAPETAAVRRYLREFLMDGRVVDIPTPLRWMLVNLVIAPFRSPKSAHAYRSIWTPAGSPLRVYSEALTAGVAARVDGPVVLAMRYGTPSIADAVAKLGDVDRIVVVPLYPQYASSTTGSVLEEVYRVLGGRVWVPPVDVLAPFHADPGFLDAQARLARPLVDGADHVVFSYHGLPVRQVRAAAPTCQLGACCEPGPSGVPAWCYRAQSLATTRALAERLDLAPTRFSTTFQSRLGQAEWLTPATDTAIVGLAKAGVKRLAVLCPSFVSDCLETLEEIGVRAREEFVAHGGEELRLVPCVNGEPDWVDALARRVATA
jgi:ferrochelatase